jgi:hypothetical protein
MGKGKPDEGEDRGMGKGTPDEGEAGKSKKKAKKPKQTGHEKARGKGHQKSEGEGHDEKTETPAPGESTESDADKTPPKGKKK